MKKTIAYLPPTNQADLNFIVETILKRLKQTEMIILYKYVEYYNTKRYHESLDNLTPQDVYLGRGEQILKQRQKIKQRTMKQRRNNYQTNKLLEQIH